MKYAIAFFLGLLCGGTLFAIGLLYNPFFDDRDLSSVLAGNAAVESLSYSAVTTKTIAFTNSGEARLQPHPKGIGKLLEKPVAQTDVMVTVLRDVRGEAAGVGVKFSSRSERTRLLRGEALVDSAWHVQLPGRGSLFVEQTENYWSFIRDVVFPAYRSSANNWKGSWTGDLTASPGARGDARATGLSGSLLGRSMAAVESLSVQAYSTDKGPVSAEGKLLIEMPTANK